MSGIAVLADSMVFFRDVKDKMRCGSEYTQNSYPHSHHSYTLLGSRNRQNILFSELKLHDKLLEGSTVFGLGP